MQAHNVAAGCAGGGRHINRFLPRIYKLAYTAGNKRLWRALANGPALHNGLGVRHAPARVVQGNSADHGSIKVGKIRTGHPRGELAGQRGVRGLRDHPAIPGDLPLRLLHHTPRRQKMSTTGGDGIERAQDPQLERLLAMRLGTAIALAGPLLDGGFFIPSRGSLSATALLRSESFEA